MRLGIFQQDIKDGKTASFQDKDKNKRYIKSIMSSAEDREKKSNAVAASMGDLLLKGYKMLATSCELCNVSNFTTL